MSLRKFMHKRNKYKEEPNFKQLAILYPEFRKVIITDISGKVKLDFKNAESLRVLTQTLLKHDFNLKVEIPPNKLVPALPLRINYILWIEDLLKHSGIDDFTSIHGIDIGTGAVCIYPLLISRILKSKMTCTDIDSETVNSSNKIIQDNNLQNLINVILVNKESILKNILQDNKNYAFLMCNPPFFETDKELKKESKQKPPRNASTGNESELVVKGGEKEFILRLIQESIEYKNRVQIYTTMFGKKSTLAFIRSELSKREIFNVIWTEFCQGYTKRWGIAWTFTVKDKIDLSTAPFIRTRTEVLLSKKDKSMEIVFPAKENLNSLNEVTCNLKKWITELKIKMTEINFNCDYPCWAYQLKGYCDTWTHARRKRRMAMRQEVSQSLINSKSTSEIESLQVDRSEFTENKYNHTENAKPLLICTLIIGEYSENDKILFKICMYFESGSGGKLSMETLRQYLINKLGIREHFHKQKPNKSNKKRKRK